MSDESKSSGKKKKAPETESTSSTTSDHRLLTHDRTPERPKPSARLISSTTPSVPRHTASANYTSATTSLIQRRNAVVLDVGVADVIPISKLLVSVLPNLEEKIIANALEKVQSQSDIFSQTTWTHFKVPPAEQAEFEEEVYTHLKSIFDAVAQFTGDGYSPKVQFEVHGAMQPRSEWPNQTRPDGSIHLKDTSLPYPRQKPVDHSDICCYIEFKKGDTPSNLNDDTVKLVYNVHHRFRTDPRCRFVFGLTIEGSTTRLWYFSRATVAVSSPFDFRTQHRTLVHIFLAFASSSIEELGFDTTIKCVAISNRKLVDEQHRGGGSPSDPGREEVGPETRSDAGKSKKGNKRSNSEARQQDLDINSALRRLSAEQPLSTRIYEFTVHTDEKNTAEQHQQGEVRTFRTIFCLANYGAVGIRARGTRVFEVTDPSQIGSKYVLKDVWINEDRTDEGATLLDLRSRLEKENPNSLQHFLQVECHGIVLTKGRQDIASSIAPDTEEQWETHHLVGTVEGRSNSLHDKQVEGLIGHLQKNPPVQLQPKFIIGRRGDPRKHYRVVFKGPSGTPLSHLSLSDAFLALQGATEAVMAMYNLGYMHRDLSCGNILLVDGENGPTGVLIDLEYTKKFPDTDGNVHDVRTGTREFMAHEVAQQRFIDFAEDELPEHNVAWFHHPIHEAESIWWIALWSFYYLQDSPVEEREKLFPDVGDGFRFHIWSSKSQFNDICTRPPKAIRAILYTWLRFIKAEYTTFHRGLADEGYQSFDYRKVLLLSLECLKSIQVALKEIRDEEGHNEVSDAANEKDDRPRKRQRP